MVVTISRTPVADMGSEALSNGIGVTRIERAPGGVERQFRTARFEEAPAGWFEYEMEDLVNTEVRHNRGTGAKQVHDGVCCAFHSKANCM